VCRDTGSAGAAAPAPSAPRPAAQNGAADGDAGLEPLIAGVPAYPEAARARGTRGTVEVEFTVTPTGAVENARVISAQPSNVFDSAALAAVARRRYPADPEREPQVLTERIEFTPPPAPRAVEAVSSTGGGPLNRCVREDAVYNYGEMVDVNLINACMEPLAVFGCAQGTGRDLGRWVCSTSEQRGDILVPAADQRLGRRYMAGNATDFRTYTYRESFPLTRAPNSQLWWVACLETDTECRSDARLWTRSVSGQDASIDPQARSPIAVASSD
jgi:TonB family protein